MYKDASFSGCIYNVEFNRERVNLWRRVLQSQPTARCCMKPPGPPQPPTIDAVSFTGFGYLLSTKRLLLALGAQSHVSLQFRTFQKNAVILLIDTLHGDSYYGIFLEVGQVVFAIRSKGQVVMLKSARHCSDGLWHEVIVCVHACMRIRLSVCANMF